jgi:predicted ATP-grasp superfamily ATP-dependent carboligase
VLFVGEAQPPIGKYRFCRQIISYAREIGVERVFTFAAMATRMHPTHRSRLFAAAADKESLEELKRLEVEILEDGNIGGLNGVLLGVVAECGMKGSCLLGEMPHLFSQLPFPKASLAILKAFTTLTGIALDFAELGEQSKAVERQLGEILSQVEEKYGEQYATETDTEGFTPEPAEEAVSEEKQRIESLFGQAARDRAKAFELKQELDRLGLFKEYEDRFLDLFKRTV